MTSRTEFFTELFRGATGRIELRRMKWNPHGGKHGKYDMLDRLFTRDIAELEAFASNGGGDIFHGVNLRDESGLATKSSISQIICSQVDTDFKITGKEKADRLLAALGLEPSFQINSGNGYHFYWLLDAPLPATEENITLIESINKGLAQRLGGDYTHDVTRILRTPGRKNSKYADNRTCEIFQARGQRYSIEQLKPFAVLTQANDDIKVDIGNGSGELPERFKKLLEDHRVVKKTWSGQRPDLRDQSRSGYDLAMANVLAGFNFTATQAAAILRHMPSGKGADAKRAYLEKTIGKAWKNRAEYEEPNEENETDEDGQEKVLFEIMRHVQTEEIEWIWDKRIPRGKLTLFDGDPGIGKSYTSLKIAAMLSVGEALPFDKAPEAPLRSIIFCPEDSPSDILKPRLEKLGADMDMIAIPHRNLDQVSLKANFLEKLLSQWPAAYCVIDPIIAFAAGRNTDKAGDVRTLVGPLIDIAEEYRVAMVLIRHLNKNLGSRALYRGQGSIDFPAICRSVFSFGMDTTGRRLMAHTKNTVTQKQRTLEFVIDENGGFAWGEESDESADDILGDPKKKPSDQLEAAKAFIVETLAKSEWVSSDKMKEMAKLKGISDRTLWRAKTDLGVKARRIKDCWYWTSP